MSFDEELDEALRRIPTWTPPAQFARSVTSNMQAQDLGWPAARPPGLVWVSLAGQGLMAAGIAAVASALVWWGIDPYLRLMAVATEGMQMRPLTVAWTCAALSLLSALFYTRRALE